MFSWLEGEKFCSLSKYKLIVWLAGSDSDTTNVKNIIITILIR
jgi:hypothetical protein